MQNCFFKIDVQYDVKMVFTICIEIKLVVCLYIYLQLYVIQCNYPLPVELGISFRIITIKFVTYKKNVFVHISNKSSIT